jgi:site-specific recombinase XerD
MNGFRFQIERQATVLPIRLRSKSLLDFEMIFEKGKEHILYNSGARVQEVADLRVGDVDLDGPFRVRLHGKGDKWRRCPLWPETINLLKQLEAV